MIGFSSMVAFDTALVRFPVGPLRRRAFRRLAAASLEARLYVEAETILAKGLIAYPDDADLLTMYALCANDQAHFGEALERWEAARRADPKRALCWYGIAGNLRSLERTDDARATIRQALGLFVGNSCVLAEAARIAAARGDHDDALDLWNKAIAADEVPHRDWLFGRAEALFKLKRFAEALAATDTLAAQAPDHPGLDDLVQAVRRVRRHCEDDMALPAIDAVPDGMVAISPDRLFARFENLGDNCEFGLVQRYSDIDPLGLFRFSWSTTESLIDVFSSRLADYGCDGDLELVVNGTDGSYDCRSLRYPAFQYHTEMHPTDIAYDALLRREVKKVGYLKKRMLSDLATAEKILVRKGGSFESGIALFRVLRECGPITLLWVTTADASHPPGSVERIEDGLLVGYISRFAPYGNAHDIDLRCWTEICCNALTWSAPDHPRHIPARNTIHQMGLDWAVTASCAKEDVASPLFPGVTTQSLTLLTDTKRADAIVAARYVEFELAPRSLVTFSLWVWIPDTFEGTFVDVYIANAGSFVAMADLARREQWQRVWSCARLPKDQTRVAAAVRVTGLAGDHIFIGAWRLESGSLPNDWSLAEAA